MGALSVSDPVDDLSFIRTALIVCSTVRTRMHTKKGTPHLIDDSQAFCLTQAGTAAKSSPLDVVTRTRKRPAGGTTARGTAAHRPRNEERQLHDLSQRQQFDCRQNGLFLPMSTRRQIGNRRFSLGLGPNRNGDVSTARGLRKNQKIAIFLILERPRIGDLPSVAVVMETKATNVSAAKFNYSVVAVPPAVFRWKCYWRDNSTTEVNACRRCVVRFGADVVSSVGVDVASDSTVYYVCVIISLFNRRASCY